MPQAKMFGKVKIEQMLTMDHPKEPKRSPCPKKKNDHNHGVGHRRQGASYTRT